jgi:hypothetical protein
LGKFTLSSDQVRLLALRQLHARPPVCGLDHLPSPVPLEVDAGEQPDGRFVVDVEDPDHEVLAHLDPREVAERDVLADGSRAISGQANGEREAVGQTGSGRSA